MIKKRKFEVGGCWEGSQWEIHYNELVSESEGYKPCKHAGSKIAEIITRYDESTYEEYSYIVPRVVVMENAAGCQTTGVCLDCIIENAELID